MTWLTDMSGWNWAHASPFAAPDWRIDAEVEKEPATACPLPATLSATVVNASVVLDVPWCV
ncbi:MAG: hypothetical protein ACXWCB_13200 [Acidimicrobiales bacterium]